MSKLSRFKLSALVALLVTLGCGTETHNSLTKTRNALEGTWKQECRADDGMSSQVILSVEGNRIVQTGTFFLGETCESDSIIFVVRKESKYKIGPTLEAEKELKEFNFLQSNDFITIQQPIFASQFNQDNFFGYKDWKAGVEKNVTNRNMSGGESQGQSKYTAFRLKNSELCIGSSSNDEIVGSTEATRIKTIQLTSDCFSKQSE